MFSFANEMYQVNRSSIFLYKLDLGVKLGPLKCHFFTIILLDEPHAPFKKGLNTFTKSLFFVSFNTKHQRRPLYLLLPSHTPSTEMHEQL